MREHQVKSLVVDKRGPHDAYGIITFGNILKTIVAEEGDIDLLNVYDVCTKPAVTLSLELDIKHAARMMVNMGIRRVLVTTQNELVGIISMTDIVAAILAIADADPA